ncbi:MAG: hypothetical protein K2P94_15820 [Rhodospirillaceae bacterium]|nr:hypothetical protein [Rhodospirillaceae bacterium]
MTNLFRNSSPGALTREQAVALVKRRLAERQRQKRQAEELAAQGRGGDTEIAHVTVGEIVLPDALQTPAVLDAIRQAAVNANIPLARLRVGSALNSINPETGQPEFFDLSKLLYDSRDHGAQLKDNDQYVPNFLKSKPPGYMPTQEELDRLPDDQKQRYADYYKGTGDAMNFLSDSVPGVGGLFGKVGRWIGRGLGDAAGYDASTREEIEKAYRTSISGRKPGP